MHFTVAVITDGKPSADEIEELMAPYQENNLGLVSEEYLEFYPLTEDEISDFKNGYEIEKSDGKIPSGTSFDTYLRDFCGYDYDRDSKQYGYYENPNAAWDAYRIGGRWCGTLTVPKGKGERGEPAWGMEDEDPYHSDDPATEKCDCARIKDLIVTNIEDLCIYSLLDITGEWYDNVDEYKIKQVINEAGENEYITLCDCHI